MSRTPIMMSFTELALAGVFCVGAFYVGHLREFESKTLDYEQRLKDANDKQAQAEQERVKAVQKAKEAEDRRIAAEAKQKEAEDRLAALSGKLKDVAAIKEMAETIAKLRARCEELERLASTERSLRPELIGLKGRLKRVAFLFDRSGSMNMNEGRWPQARAALRTWMKHIPMEECCVIVFSDGVDEFPGQGKLQPMRSPADRDACLKAFEKWWLKKELDSEGETNTLAAIEAAYEHKEVDTIILFTDGAPRTKDTFNAPIDLDMEKQIYARCEEHRDVPVNAIGLGNYFDPAMSKFLFNLTAKTGGAFLGR